MKSFTQYFVVTKHSTDETHYKFLVALNNNDRFSYPNTNIRPEKIKSRLHVTLNPLSSSFQIDCLKNCEIFSLPPGVTPS